MVDTGTIGGIAAFVAAIVIIVLIRLCLWELFNSICNCLLCGLCYLGNKATKKKEKQPQQQAEQHQEFPYVVENHVYYVQERAHDGDRGGYDGHVEQQQSYYPVYPVQHHPHNPRGTSPHNSDYVPQRFSSRPFYAVQPHVGHFVEERTVSSGHPAHLHGEGQGQHSYEDERRPY